ncbi:YybH family protein [Saliphagus infecundisoli]|uniref:YybH family protein n=1 Tax=Saliphagus infecundisoli TaxID=1849069 RepID=A0ABD5QB88_9EURY|nr:nuclear transport factor 2 family protein [Saliphagus infecundisoli]
MTTEPLETVSEEEHDEFESLIQRFTAAWSTDTGTPEYEEVSEFYAPEDDVILYDFVDPRAGYHGWEELRPGLEKEIYAGVSSLDWTPSDVWAVRRDDIAWTGFNWDMTIRFDDGDTETIDTGRMTMIWEMRNGSWRIVHEHSSVPRE